MRKLVGFSICLLFTLFSACQNLKERTVIGKKHAEEEIKKAIIDKNYNPFYDTLIANKEIAIAVAEPILFSIYGKKNIIKQRPYECYLIDGYWDISGTLPQNRVGGVFEIIINSKDGKVIKLIHGK